MHYREFSSISMRFKLLSDRSLFIVHLSRENAMQGCRDRGGHRRSRPRKRQLTRRQGRDASIRALKLLPAPSGDGSQERTINSPVSPVGNG